MARTPSGCRRQGDRQGGRGDHHDTEGEEIKGRLKPPSPGIITTCTAYYLLQPQQQPNSVSPKPAHRALQPSLLRPSPVHRNAASLSSGVRSTTPTIVIIVCRLVLLYVWVHHTSYHVFQGQVPVPTFSDFRVVESGGPMLRKFQTKTVHIKKEKKLIASNVFVKMSPQIKRLSLLLVLRIHGAAKTNNGKWETVYRWAIAKNRYSLETLQKPHLTSPLLLVNYTSYQFRAAELPRCISICLLRFDFNCMWPTIRQSETTHIIVPHSPKERA